MKTAILLVTTLLMTLPATTSIAADALDVPVADVLE